MTEEPELSILEEIHTAIVPGDGSFDILGYTYPVIAYCSGVPHIHVTSFWVEPIVLRTFEKVCVTIG